MCVLIKHIFLHTWPLVWLLFGVYASDQSTCSLRVLGTPDGRVSASMSCVGQPVAVAAHNQALSSFKHSGVVLDPGTCEPSDCLLTICSETSLKVNQLLLRGVVLPDLQSAILCFSGDSNVVLQGAVVANNTAGYGAMLAHRQVSLALQECAFTNNTAINMDVARGGALSLIENVTATIQDSQFVSNQAVGGTLARGGSLFVTGTVSLTITNSSFSSNQATYVPAHPASSGGGAIFVEGDTRIAISGTVFLDNYAAGPVTGAGGAIAAANTSSVVLRSCIFRRNGVGGYAAFGGVINAKANATVSISSCHFSENTANSSEVTSLQAGEASVWGRAVGACILASDSVLLEVNNCTFRNNTSVREMWGTASGGAMTASKNAVVRVTNSIFAANNVLGDYGMGGGAITSSKKTNVSIDGCTFTDNIAHCSSSCTGGAVHVGDSGLLSISNSVFRNNLADSPTLSGGSDGAGGAVGGLFNAMVSIHNCTLVNNSAAGYKSSGGGVYADGTSRVTITDSTLVGNKAATGGGIGAVQGRLWVVKGCLFANHSVPSHGGGIMVAGSPEMVISDTALIGNRGSEGGGLYAHTFDDPFKISMSNTTISSNFAMTGGGCLFRGGEVHLGEGVVIVNNNASQEAGGLGWFSGCLGTGLCPSAVNISCSAVVENNTASVAGGGMFIGQGAQLDGVDVQSNQCSMSIARNNRAAFGDSDVFYVRQDCQAGEVSRGGWCDACPVNMYSFTSNAQQCEVCPPVGAICPGGAHLLPQSGYWHSHNFSTQVHRCPNYRACEPSGSSSSSSSHSLSPIGRRLQSAGSPASSQDMDWQCSDGYRGHVCGSCTKGYGMRSAFVCGECMPVAKTMVLYVVAVAGIVLLLSYMAHATWLDNRVSRFELRVSDVLKVLVLYTQYLVILGAARVDWPDTMRAVFVAVGYVLSSCTGQVISLDCMFPQGFTLPAGIARGLVYLLTPAVVAGAVLVIFMLAWCGQALYRWRCGHASMALGRWLLVRLPVILLVVFYFFYPALVRVAWAAFACYPIDVPGVGPYAQYAVADAPGGYWVGSMDTVCWAGYHKVWALAVCLPLVLLFCVLVPAAIYMVLHLYNTGALQSPNFTQNFGFLFRNFKPERFYWEAVVAVQTVLLVCVYVFSHVVGVYYQVVMYTIIFVLSLVSQLLFQPYAFEQLQHMQLMACACLVISSFVALTFFNVGGGQDVSTSRYKEVVGTLVLVLNALFLAYCVYCVARLAVLGLRQRLRGPKRQGCYTDRERAMMDRRGGSACISPASNSGSGGAFICSTSSVGGASQASSTLGSSGSAVSRSSTCAVVFIDSNKDVAAGSSRDLELQPPATACDSVFAVAVPQAAAALDAEASAGGAEIAGAPPPAGGFQLPRWLQGTRRQQQ